MTTTIISGKSAPEDCSKINVFIVTAYHTQISVHIHKNIPNNSRNALIARLVNNPICIIIGDASSCGRF